MHTHACTHALLAEPADGDARLLAAEDQVRVVLGHCPSLCVFYVFVCMSKQSKDHHDAFGVLNRITPAIRGPQPRACHQSTHTQPPPIARVDCTCAAEGVRD